MTVGCARAWSESSTRRATGDCEGLKLASSRMASSSWDSAAPLSATASAIMPAW
jgi:hypothetical protein